MRTALIVGLFLVGCGEPGEVSDTPTDAGLASEGLTFPDGGPTADLMPPRLDGAPAGDSQQPDASASTSLLDNVTLFINLGDSLAAGYYAKPGRSYRKLLVQNDDAAYPAFKGKDLETRFPGITIIDRSKSGATTKDVVSQAKAVVGNPVGNTLVVISAGGNDFNDKFLSMVDPALTQATAKNASANLGKITAHFGNKAMFPGKLVIVMLNVHDPTDGKGTIPLLSSLNGFCKAIQGPLGLLFGPTATKNLTAYNKHLADFATQHNVELVDNHATFLGHGFHHGDKSLLHYDAGDPTLWFHTDCAHLNNRGHHELRKLIWNRLTGGQ